MRLTLCKFSALSAHRAIRTGALASSGVACDLRPPERGASGRWTRALLAGNPVVALTGFPTRGLDVVVSDPKRRIKVAGVSNTLHKRGLPAGSFVEVGEGVAISSPELTFVELAQELSPANHLMLGFELCGTFSRSHANPRDGAVTYGLEPLTSVERLRSFVESCKGVWGLDRARHTLGLLADNAWSTTESVVATMLSLPVHELGYELGPLKLNPRSKAKEGRVPLERGSRVPDIMIGDTKVGLNYDGFAHLDLDRVAAASAAASASPDDANLSEALERAKASVREKVVDDLRRNRELSSRGLVVLPVTKEDLFREGGLDVVVLELLDVLENEYGLDLDLQRRFVTGGALAKARQDLLWSLLPGSRGRQLGREIEKRRRSRTEVHVVVEL